jgi:hypothetical protein
VPLPLASTDDRRLFPAISDPLFRERSPAVKPGSLSGYLPFFVDGGGTRTRSVSVVFGCVAA